MEFKLRLPSQSSSYPGRSDRVETVRVEEVVLIVRVVEQVGVQEGAEAVAPLGRPVAEKVTDCEVPETRVAVMVLEPEEP